jgi:hypothetical protein
MVVTDIIKPFVVRSLIYKTKKINEVVLPYSVN